MIATVRIAPVEKWCEEMQGKVSANPELALVAGLEIEILTETAFLGTNPSGEEEWHWQTTEDSLTRMLERSGKERNPPTSKYARVCKSMLEMD